MAVKDPGAVQEAALSWLLHLGQLIDGLEARADEWRFTAVYLETGEAPDGFVIEQCSDAEEARRIAEHYQRINGRVLEQWEGQQGGLGVPPRRSLGVQLCAASPRPVPAYHRGTGLWSIRSNPSSEMPGRATP